jgi:hypothetical protein
VCKKYFVQSIQIIIPLLYMLDKEEEEEETRTSKEGNWNLLALQLISSSTLSSPLALIISRSLLSSCMLSRFLFLYPLSTQLWWWWCLVDYSWKMMSFIHPLTSTCMQFLWWKISFPFILLGNGKKAITKIFSKALILFPLYRV